MNTPNTRRAFLKTGGAALALAALSPQLLAANEPPAPPVAKRPIRKGIMWATVGLKGSVLDKMKAVKAAGFEGAEMMSHMDVDEVLRARDETGLEIPSVCGQHHWGKPLSDPDPKVREAGLAALKQSLREAKRYGALSVLLVPATVNKDVSYVDAYSRSQEEIRKAIPLAEELGVKIAIENVWNQFLLSPLEAARYVDEFNSPWVGWHFDVGNVVTYGWPEQWIRILGKRILQLHIKEFSRQKRDKEGLWKGFAVPLLEGDNNWPAVMKAVDGITYLGWAITEQPGGDTSEGLKNLADKLGEILALPT
ncbi:MAG: sugar phosphate isomerase/epimerase [Opitutaceae bacterium]|nr:sugar phosphate isomerase/epimerase [Verrucomicrobiales bacterium]